MSSTEQSNSEAEFEELWRSEMREHGIPEDKITELWEAGREAGRKASEAARRQDGNCS